MMTKLRVILNVMKRSVRTHPILILRILQHNTNLQGIN